MNDEINNEDSKWWDAREAEMEDEWTNEIEDEMDCE